MPFGVLAVLLFGLPVPVAHALAAPLPTVSRSVAGPAHPGAASAPPLAPGKPTRPPRVRLRACTGDEKDPARLVKLAYAAVAAAGVPPPVPVSDRPTDVVAVDPSCSPVLHTLCRLLI
ncbi:MAG: hypothetical protein U0736_16940 [Gemmataceae bacterium]